MPLMPWRIQGEGMITVFYVAMCCYDFHFCAISTIESA